MHSKPILRWTVGNVSDEGIECLKLSIKWICKIYGDTFDYYLCHNNIDLDKLNWIKNTSIKLLNQHDYVSDLNINPMNNNPCWKLYPPRIDINRHEIFIDNDLIIYKRLPVIDKFLERNNLLFITEAIRRSNGSFDSIIKSTKNLNTGLFGLYPGFDLKNRINETLNLKIIKTWSCHLDEQGLLAYIFHNSDYELVTLDDIYVCHQDYQYKIGKYGQHFVELNRQVTCHWITFLNSKLI